MESFLLLALTLGLVLGNGFFVAAEFALISARRTQIEPIAAAGSRRAQRTLEAMENVGLMLAGTQLGVTVCSLGLGAAGEPTIAKLLDAPFDRLGVPESFQHPLSFIISLTIVAGLHVVLGEMVPKNLSLAGPERAAIILEPPLLRLVRILKPIIFVMNALSTLILKALRVEQRDEVASAFTVEEVAGLVTESAREGLLDQDEHELLASALNFEGQDVTSVLLPADELVVVSDAATAADVEQRCVETGYSRFPVSNSSGDLLGYLHLKDVLETDPEKRHRPIASKWIRPMASVAPTDSLRSVLRTMQARGAHMARVVERDGAVLGVVALEDVLERLVGEVHDATQTANS